MPMPTILSGSTLAAGIRSDFQATHDARFAGVWEGLSMVMGRVTSDKRTETYGFHESVPYPELWLDGDSIPTEATGSGSFSVTNFRYGKRIPWKKIDREDNRVGDLGARARTLGTRFATLDSKAFAEIMTGSASLLQAIPNAPDGAALYSATTGGGANRFGRSGGNVVSAGSWSATADDILVDLFAAMTAFADFQDTKGEPFYDPDISDPEYVLYVSNDNLKAWVEAIKAITIHSVESSTGAAIQNPLDASGARIKLKNSQRISGNDAYLWRADAPVRAVFVQERTPVETAEAHADNSDVSRDTQVEYVQFSTRRGYGVNHPYATVKIDYS